MAPDKKRFTEDFISKWGKASDSKPAKVGESLLERQKRLLNSNPNNPRLWMAYGETLLSLGKDQDAIKCFNRVKDLAPSTPGLTLNIARAQAGTGNFDSASDLLLNNLKNAIPDKDHPLNSILGSKESVNEILEQMQVEELENPSRQRQTKAIQLLTTVPGLGSLKAKALYDAGFRTVDDLRDASVEELLSVEGIALKSAQKIKIIVTLDEKSEGIGQPVIDELHIEEAVEEFACPLCSTILEKGDNVCYQCGMKFKDEAESAIDDDLTLQLNDIEDRIRSDPSDIEQWFLKGEVLSKMERNEEAIEALNEITRLDANYPGVWNMKAEVFTQMGEHKKAASCYKRAMELGVTTAITETDDEMEDLLLELESVEDDTEVDKEVWLAKQRQIQNDILDLDDKDMDMPGHIHEVSDEESDILDSITNKLDSLDLDLSEDLDSLDLDDDEIGLIESTVKPLDSEPEAFKAPAPDISEDDEAAIDELAHLFSEGAEAMPHKPEPISEDDARKIESVTKPLRSQPPVAKDRGMTNGVRKGLTNGLAKGSQGRTNGMTNGVTNGLTNGLGRTNGMTNGLTNGLGRTNGMTNGLTNGLGRTNGMTNGLTNGLGRTNGMTNGLTNGLGRTNGMTNGLTNGLGRTNGMTNGLTNGITNGLTNGVTNGTGVTNGLTNGLRTLRNGMTNGLTNGTGMTNGLGGARFNREARRNKWKLYIIPLVAVLLLLIPMVSFSPPPVEADSIVIDGEFSDWEGVAETTSQSEGVDFNPNIDIVGVAVENNDDKYLSFHISVVDNGQIMAGEPVTDAGLMDVFHLFLDTDQDHTTGYMFEGMGADFMLEIKGWNGNVVGSQLYTFRGSDNDDWHGYTSVGNIVSRSQDQTVETQIAWSALDMVDPGPVTVAVHSQSYDGYHDKSDHLVSNSLAILSIDQRSVCSETLSGAGQSLLGFDATATEIDAVLESIQIAFKGTAPLSSITSARVLNSAGSSVAETSQLSSTINLNMGGITIPAGQTQSFTVAVDISASAGSGTTIGAQITSSAGISVTGGIASLTTGSSSHDLGYIDVVPIGVMIDGGFSDWSSSSNDEIEEPTTGSNPSIDISKYGAYNDGSKLAFYLRTNGDFMGGASVPITASTRAPSSTPPPPSTTPSQVDSDGDGILDQYEPGYEFDFNNDGILDTDSNDDDGDGEIDYNAGGTDEELYNEDTKVTRYIGPEDPVPALNGYDRSIIYVDADNDTTTGYSRSGLGVDYVIEFTGKYGDIKSSSTREFTGRSQGEWDWTEITMPDFQYDSKQLEVMLDIQTTGDISASFETISWNENSDTATEEDTPLTLPATRSGSESDSPMAGDMLQLAEVTSGNGSAASDLFGWNVSYAGDVNNDNYPDVVVGAPGASGNEGRAYVFFGYYGFNTSNSNYMQAAFANVTITGAASGDHFGWDVSDAGDVDNDGFDDIIVGAPDTTNGNAYIFYGKGLNWEEVTGDGSWDLGTTSANVTLTGAASGDDFGASVSGAGNYDNSGNSDVIVGAPYANSGKGKAYIFYGDGSIPTTAATADVSLNGTVSNGNFGFSVSTAGNTDGSAGSEVIVGEPGNEKAYVFSLPTSETADTDWSVSGTLTNTYTSTQSSNDGYEEIEEIWGGGSGGGTSFFSDGFESGDLTTGGWTVVGDPLASTENVNTGTYSCDLGSANSVTTNSIARTIDSTGKDSITLSYSVATNGLDSGVDYFRAEYDVGSGYVILEELTGDLAYADKSFLLPASANDNPNLAIRFYLYRTSLNEDAYVDDVVVTYVPKVSSLEHKWNISLTSKSQNTFYLEANHTSNTEGDNFEFYYSTAGTGTVGSSGWTKMVTVTKTTDDGSYQSYTDDTLSGLSGIVYVGVIDADRSTGNTVNDTLYVDHMYFVSTPYKVIAGIPQFASTDFTTGADIADTGTVTNTHTSTQTQNDGYESITEVSAAATYDEDFATSETYNQSNTGSNVNDYTETANLDGTTQDIVEALVTGGISTITLIPTESFESTSWPADWTEAAGTAWNPETDYANTGTYSADFDGSTGAGVSGTLQSPSMDTASATSITVDFWWREDDADATEYGLYYYDNTGTWDLIEDLATLQSTEDTWYNYQETITDSQYLHSAFQIQWRAHGSNGEAVWLDDVNVTMSVTIPSHYSLEHKWTFTTIPSSALQYEFQLRAGWDSGGTPDDEFMFYYAETNSGDVGTAAWTYMFSVDAQAQTTYTFDLDADGFIGGAFYVGVVDNVSTDGSQADTLEIDYMCVNTTLTVASTRLEHKWTMAGITTGTDTRFYLEANRTNQDSENMEFYYSTTGSGLVSSWTKMLDVTKTSDDDSYQSFSDATLDAFTGTLYIGVIDASTSDSNLDTVYIDHMYLRVSGASIKTHFGWSVADAGDVDNNGNDDVIIGSPGTANGNAYIYYGSPIMGLTSSTISNTTQADFNTGDLNSTFAVSAGDVNLTNPQNFDAQTISDDPGGWTVTETGGSIEVSDDQSVSGYNSVKFTDTTDRVNITKTSMPLSTTFTIEFDARVTTTTGWFQILGPESDYTAGIQMLFYTDGTIIYYDGAIQVLQTYNANQWYHFQLDVDCSATPSVYDIYIDGVSRATGAELINDVDVGIITFQTGTAATVAYLDNVKLSTYIVDTYGYVESDTYTAGDYVGSVTPTWSATLNSQTMTVKVSRDGGTTYSPSLTSGSEYSFSNGEPAGSQLRYKVEMNGNGSATPVLHSISIEYYCPASANVTITGESSGDKFGYSVHGLDDFNGDTYDDVIVGAPYYSSGKGAVYIFNGSATMASTISASNADYVNYSYNASSHFGWSVCKVGDLDGNSKNDVLIGAPHYTAGSNTNAGITWVMFASGTMVIIISEYSTFAFVIFMPMVIFSIVRRKRKVSLSQ